MAYVKRQDEMNDAERAFWARYAESLLKRLITGKNAEWHLRHAQRFCYGLEGKLLRDVLPSDLDAYLDGLGRRQAVEA